MSFAALQKKVADTLAKLNAAKTASARKTASAAYAAALTALTEAKVKKSYKKKTVEEEEETDDGEAEAEDEAEDEAEAEEESEDESAAEDDDDDEDEDEPEEKKGKKATASASADLETFVRELTGQKSTARARGVLQAMADGHARIAATEAQVARLRADRRREQRNDLIASGMREGKLTPGQRAWAKTQSIASLKAYLETTAPRFSPRPAPMPGAELQQAQPTEMGDDARDAEGVTSKEREICRITGTSIESFKKQRDASSVPTLPKVN